MTSSQIGLMQRYDIHKEFYKDLEREQDRKTHTEKYDILTELRHLTKIFADPTQRLTILGYAVLMMAALVLNF